MENRKVLKAATAAIIDEYFTRHGRPSASALVKRYIERQLNGDIWDDDPCYGLGLAYEHELCRAGIDYKRLEGDQLPEADSRLWTGLP